MRINEIAVRMTLGGGRFPLAFETRFDGRTFKTKTRTESESRLLFYISSR